MSKARDLANAGTALTTVSATELGYLDGVTSAVQTQINSKEATLPSQTGNSGKFLTTDGTNKSWGTVASGQLKETVFTSSNSSWTIPTGVTGIWALVVGGGGGGGASGTATANNCGGGGGAGQVLETYFAIATDTTLNITVGGGGAGGTSGGKGSNGGTSSIVGNQSSTTFASATGGGGGGGGTAANIGGLSGASGGGGGFASGAQDGGGGGGFKTPALGSSNGYYTMGNIVQIGGGANATTYGVTGYTGGTQNSTSNYGGEGIMIWNRRVAAGGSVPDGGTSGILQSYGAGAFSVNNTAGNSATANTGAGGNAGKTNATTARAGGSGGSGLVVLRYVG